MFLLFTDTLSSFLSKCWIQRRLSAPSQESTRFRFPPLSEKKMSKDLAGSNSTITTLRQHDPQKPKGLRKHGTEELNPYKSSPKSATRRCRHHCRHRHHHHHHKHHPQCPHSRHNVIPASSNKIRRESLQEPSPLPNQSTSMSFATYDTALAIPPSSPLDKFRLAVESSVGGVSCSIAKRTIGSRRKRPTSEKLKLEPRGDLAPIPRFRSR